MWPASKFLLILALIFFVLDALLLGGVITGSNLAWLLPAGLAAWVLAVLVP
jgi:hypothetical protein